MQLRKLQVQVFYLHVQPAKLHVQRSGLHLQRGGLQMQRSFCICSDARCTCSCICSDPGCTDTRYTRAAARRQPNTTALAAALGVGRAASAAALCSAPRLQVRCLPAASCSPPGCIAQPARLHDAAGRAARAAERGCICSCTCSRPSCTCSCKCRPSRLHLQPPPAAFAGPHTCNCSPPHLQLQPAKWLCPRQNM